MDIIYLIFLIGAAIFSITALLVLTSAFFGFLITKVPFVPSPGRDVELLVDRLGLSAKDHIYDLGSGDGRVLFVLERLTGAKTTGYELMRWAHLTARLTARLKHSKAQFIRRNFFKENLSPATVVYCYLFPEFMAKVGDKVMAECRPGTIVVSRDFRIPNLNQTDYFRTSGVHEIFIYTV